MTRTRATADNIPTPLMGEYHGQRAMTGLAQARYGPGCLPCARRRRWPSRPSQMKRLAGARPPRSRRSDIRQHGVDSRGLAVAATRMGMLSKVAAALARLRRRSELGP
jgi:hypothetical protein